MYYISGYDGCSDYFITDSKTKETEIVNIAKYNTYEFSNKKYCNTKVLGCDIRVSPAIEIIPNEYIDLLEYCRNDIIKCTLAGMFYDEPNNLRRNRITRIYKLINITDIVLKYFRSIGIDYKYPLITKYGVGYLEVNGNYIKFKPNSIMVGLAEELKYSYLYNTDTDRIYIVAYSGGTYYYYDMVSLTML